MNLKNAFNKPLQVENNNRTGTTLKLYKES
jgi:hypothetical protein